MKKMLAVLLALVLALSCTLAMAETTDTVESMSFQGLTIESEYDVNREVLKNVLTQMGLDEATLTIIDTVAAIIDQAGERLVVAKDGAQCELLLKDTSLVNLVALVSDSGVTIGSNLVPNYALGITFEEIGSMIISMIQEQADSMESLDIPALQEALTTHVNTFITACTGAVIPGEIQQGDFVQDGISYNSMLPMQIDLPTIVTAANELCQNLQKDESVKAALQKLALMGVNVDLEQSNSLDSVDTATLPTVNVEVYMNVNEQGEQSDPTQVSVFVTPAGETDPATVVYTKVNGNSITVEAQFISANTSLNYSMDRDPADPLSINCRLDAYVGDFYAGFAAVVASNDEAVTYDAYVYVQDTEKAIAEEHGSITMTGELTQSVSDEATVLTLTDLTGENSSDALGGLGMDLLMSGMGVLSTAAELMPDEVNTITSLFMGSADAAA